MIKIIYNPKKLKKAISLITLITFIFTNTAYGVPENRSLFKGKKVDYEKLRTEKESLLEKKKAVFNGEESSKKEKLTRQTKEILLSHLNDLTQLHIPPELGRVIEVYQNTKIPQSENRLIVHIQDLHTNPEAQYNEAGILELLLKDYNLGLICSEGADGVVDTSSVSSFPDYNARFKTARLFVDSGELTAEEFLSITKYPELPIWGIEDRDLYFKNIIDFNKIMKYRPDSMVFISRIKSVLEELKPKIYSKELLELDNLERDYENQKIETDKYLKRLSGYLQTFNIPITNYKNVTLLNEALIQESSIDQQRLMQETRNLLLNLQTELSKKGLKSELDSLMVEAGLFKDQKISPFSFYSYLKDLSLRYLKDSITKYPELDNFLSYLTKLNSLDSTKLFIEMESLTYDIKQHLAKKEEDRLLTQALRNIKFLEGFFNLKISNEELDYYLQNKESHKVGWFKSAITNLTNKTNSTNQTSYIDFNPRLIDDHLQELEDFYKIVKARDIAMVNNSLSEIEKRNIKVAALITGGFHTKGITRLLKEKGYSYVVISPYSKTDIDDENYRFLLSGKRRSLEELLKQLDFTKLVKDIAGGLRVPLVFNGSLIEAFNNHPEIKKLGLTIEDLRPAIVAALLSQASPKELERWSTPIADIGIYKNLKGDVFVEIGIIGKGPTYFQVLRSNDKINARLLTERPDGLTLIANVIRSGEDRVVGEDKGFEGSVLKGLQCLIRLRDGENLTEIPLERFMEERRGEGVRRTEGRYAGRPYSYSTIRHELRSLISIGIIKIQKDNQGRKVIVFNDLFKNITQEQIDKIDESIKEIMGTGKGLDRWTLVDRRGRARLSRIKDAVTDVIGIEKLEEQIKGLLSVPENVNFGLLRDLITFHESYISYMVKEVLDKGESDRNKLFNNFMQWFNTLGKDQQEDYSVRIIQSVLKNPEAWLPFMRSVSMDPKKGLDVISRTKVVFERARRGERGYATTIIKGENLKEVREDKKINLSGLDAQKREDLARAVEKTHKFVPTKIEVVLCTLLGGAGSRYQKSMREEREFAESLRGNVEKYLPGIGRFMDNFKAALPVEDVPILALQLGKTGELAARGMVVMAAENNATEANEFITQVLKKNGVQNPNITLFVQPVVPKRIPTREALEAFFAKETKLRDKLSEEERNSMLEYCEKHAGEIALDEKGNPIFGPENHWDFWKYFIGEGLFLDVVENAMEGENLRDVYLRIYNQDNSGAAWHDDGPGQIALNTLVRKLQEENGLYNFLDKIDKMSETEWEKYKTTEEYRTAFRKIVASVVEGGLTPTYSQTGGGIFDIEHPDGTRTTAVCERANIQGTTPGTNITNTNTMTVSLLAVLAMTGLRPKDVLEMLRRKKENGGKLSLQDKKRLEEGVRMVEELYVPIRQQVKLVGNIPTQGTERDIHGIFGRAFDSMLLVGESMQTYEHKMKELDIKLIKGEITYEEHQRNERELADSIAPILVFVPNKELDDWRKGRRLGLAILRHLRLVDKNIFVRPPEEVLKDLKEEERTPENFLKALQNEGYYLDKDHLDLIRDFIGRQQSLVSLEGIFQSAIQGDINAYNKIKHQVPDEIIKYFESRLPMVVDNIPESLFGYGFGYDIRGNALPIQTGIVDLTPENVYLIGKLIGIEHCKPGDRVLLTGDGRIHTPILRYAMALGFASVGVDVDFCEDLLTTGAHNVYAAENPGRYNAQIQVSGSHGVYQKNGLKIKVDFEGNGTLDPLYGQGLANLYKERTRILSERKSYNVGKITEITKVGDALLGMYDTTLPTFTKDEILVVDARAGAAGPITAGFFKKRGFYVIDMDELLKIKGESDVGVSGLIESRQTEIINQLKEVWQNGNRKIVFMLNMHPDPYMGRGIWDPSKPDALVPTQMLIKLINNNRSEDMPIAIGGVFDGDADRFCAVKENGEGVPAFEMTIPYYQRFLLDPQNRAAIITMVKRGGGPLWLALDVRTNSKLERVLKNISEILAEEAKDPRIKPEDILKTVYINTGYPPQLRFIEWRIEEMDRFVTESGLNNDPEFMENYKHLKRTYYTAEASGHNFFHVAPSNPERPCDCGLAAFVNLIHIRETLGDIEGKYLERLKENLLVDLFETFPSTFTSSELRLSIPNAVKLETAKQLGKWLKETYGQELKVSTIEEPEKIGDMLYQPAGDGFVTVAGFKAQFKNGDSILIRWSNTGEELQLLFEGHTLDALISRMQEVYNRLKEEKDKGLDLTNLEKDIARLEKEKRKLVMRAGGARSNSLQDSLTDDMLKEFGIFKEGWDHILRHTRKIILDEFNQRFRKRMDLTEEKIEEFGRFVLEQLEDVRWFFKFEPGVIEMVDIADRIKTYLYDLQGLQPTGRMAGDIGRGSVWGLLNTMARLGIKAGDKITVLGLMSERLKDEEGKTWSESSVRREFADAMEKLGLIRRTGEKDEKNRDVYEVLMSFTPDQLASLQERIQKMLDRGRIRDDELQEIHEAIVDLKTKEIQKNIGNIFVSLLKEGHAISKDFITPYMMKSGLFQAQVRVGLVNNATTNPTSNAQVFEQMIKSGEWVPIIKEMVEKGMSDQEIYDNLFIDYLVVPAMKIFVEEGVCERTNYMHGYVSYEFRPAFTSDPDIKPGDPRFEDQVMAALDELKRLDALITERSGGLHNFFIKVPATHVGVEAGKRAIALGININFTLIATKEQYIECVKAYKSGVMEYVQNGQKRGKVGQSPYAVSVASDFVSRTDREIDPLLTNAPELKTQSGLAYAIGRVYRIFEQEFVKDEKWNQFATENNVPIQQIYWGSTGVKVNNIYTTNPHYAGPLRLKGTVNTAPPEVVDAMSEEVPFDGNVETPNYQKHDAVLEKLTGLRINIDEIQNKVYRSGLVSFAKDDQKTFEKIGEFIKSIREEQKMALEREKRGASVIGSKLRAILNAAGKTANMASRYLKGGYNQDGYGVPEGAAIDGSFAFEGNQGYFAEEGKEVFLETVNKMRDFFKKRADRIGKPIRYIIKPGIGGQHTPFQGIASVFEMLDLKTGKTVQISGEYELGKNFENSIEAVLGELHADIDEVVVIPSSKSGSTDETMLIFEDIFYALLKRQAEKVARVNGKEFADLVFDTLHDINFKDGNERPGKDLFKVEEDRFGTNSLITLVYNRARQRNLNLSKEDVKNIFAKVLGNMFFETTDRPDQSRLSAFIRNSGLDKELGEDAPGFGAMFDNVGGRWTGDLHMMTFLAYYGLDAEAYWRIRREGISKVREGNHIGNLIGNKIVDEGITDIALVVPDEFFWFGKSNEQNFNESIWQVGFANLIAIKQSHWDAQKQHYANNPRRLVINMSNLLISEEEFNVVRIDTPDFSTLDRQGIANAMGELFTTFYGITNTVGNRLIARALYRAGYTPEDVDLNDLDNPATKIVQENLYLRQPFVELGKGLLETRLKALQTEEARSPGAIENAYEEIKQLARNGKLETNISELDLPSNITTQEQFNEVMKKAIKYAQRTGRKFVPFIYLEGERFYSLRDYLISQGIEWVMQGTGDQHISYQQVLAQPQKYLPFIISFVPESPLPGRPAIGFAKSYLHNISPHMVRDFFAEASYKALTELRRNEGGLGIFLRLMDSNARAGFTLDIAKTAKKQGRLGEAFEILDDFITTGVEGIPGQLEEAKAMLNEIMQEILVFPAKSVIENQGRVKFDPNKAIVIIAMNEDEYLKVKDMEGVDIKVRKGDWVNSVRHPEIRPYQIITLNDVQANFIDYQLNGIGLNEINKKYKDITRAIASGV